MDGGVEDGGHAPIDADISVSDELSKTLVILDNSVNGRSPVALSKLMGEDIRSPSIVPHGFRLTLS